ncbi:MAG: glycoside hydrolase family 2 TIM barrel-domain containing protein [Candidatus Bathyarchaeia archaeon]
MSVPRPEHPRPDFERIDWRNLNGEWQFTVDVGSSGVEQGWQSGGREFDQRIIVPFPPESRLSGLGHTDFMHSLWYRRPFAFPDGWAGRRVLLHFGAVDYEATVWVNGVEVGHHRGCYTPFTCDITHAAYPGEPNSLVVNAKDDCRSGLQPSGKQSPRLHSYGCMYTRVTGIWQTVWLEAVPRSYIQGFRLMPDLENAAAYVTLRLGGDPGRFEACLTVLNLDGSELRSFRRRVSGSTVTIPLEIEKARAWSPEDPYLYGLRLELLGEEGVRDEVQSYFGLRSVRVEQNHILLNGKPRFLRFVLDQGYYPDGLYTAPSDEALRKDIELAQAMGFNGARLHQKVFEPRFLYWADRLGYLVSGEFGDWGLNLAEPKAREAIVDEWMEALERDFNHPCLVMWTPFNERVFRRGDEASAALIRRVYRLTKRLDPTRPVIDTSGYTHVETDIYDVHDYEQDPAVFKSHYDRFAETGKGDDLYRRPGSEDAAYAGQPVMVSEYGGTWWREAQAEDGSWGYGKRPRNVQELLERYRALTEALLLNPLVAAFCYTQLYDVEQEANGLYTYAREPKLPPEAVRRINRQPARIEYSSTGER